MKKLFSILIVSLFVITVADSQIEKIEVEGAIRIGNSSGNPEPGTIRFNDSTSDFEGWNGTGWVSLTAGTETVKDIDNNSYSVTSIGNQTWLGENLRATRYNDGTPIPVVTDSLEWTNLSTPSYTWYNNTFSDFGALYNWFALDTLSNGNKNICPTGWHVPSDDEWTVLTSAAGGGGNLKETGLAHWIPDNIGATNSSGFKGLGAGQRTHLSNFGFLGQAGSFWTSTTFLPNPSLANSKLLWYDDDFVTNVGEDKRAGNSIRCINDCVLIDECDGLDNDCDGMIDESDLEGTNFNVRTEAWCGAVFQQNGYTYADLVNQGSGVYTVIDMSFGAYEVCYGPNVPIASLPGGNLALVDNCNTMSYSGFSQFGEVYEFFSMSTSGPDWTFEWGNDYGEGGTTTITRTDGKHWPSLTF